MYLPEIMKLWSATNIYKFCIGFLCINCLWQIYLNIRQYRLMSRFPEPPAKLRRIVDPVYYQKARDFRLDITRYEIVECILTHLVTIAFLHFGVALKLWKICPQLLARLGYKTKSELVLSAVFTSLAATISNLAGLPLDAYTTFFIDIKHGICRPLGVKMYLLQRSIGFVKSQVTTVAMSVMAVYLVKRFGPVAWVVYWAARCAFNILYEMLYMTVIAPYFQAVFRLPSGPLRRAAEDLANSIGFPLAELFVFGVSRFTSVSNAQIAGMFRKKYVILFDTLFVTEFVFQDDAHGLNKTSQGRGSQARDSQTRTSQSRESNDSGQNSYFVAKRRFADDDILAIICHEMGHWKMSHIAKLFAFAEIERGMNNALVALLYRNPIVFHAFGFNNNKEMPTVIGILLTTSILLMPFNNLATFIRTGYKRKCEIEADKFVHTMQYGPFMERAVIRMNMDSLSFPLVDSLYTAWYKSHPPLPRRIEILRGDYSGLSGLSTCHQSPGAATDNGAAENKGNLDRKSFDVKSK